MPKMKGNLGILYWILLIPALWLGLASFFAHDSFKAYIGKNSYINLIGSTNLDEFKCHHKAIMLDGRELLGVVDPVKRKITFNNHSILIKVQEFDCSPSLLKKDLVKTLDVSSHPAITARFIDFAPYHQPDLLGMAECQVMVEVRGVSKVYQAPFGFAYDDNWFLLVGSLKLKMSDFQIEPPTKMMGLVKVDDELKIRFHLRLELKS